MFMVTQYLSLATTDRDARDIQAISYINAVHRPLAAPPNEVLHV